MKWQIIIILMMSVLTLSIVSAVNTIRIETKPATWNDIKITGNEQNFLLTKSSSTDKKADFCWYLKDGINPASVDLTVKSLFYLNGTCIRDDKNKCIVGIKYETSKCNVNGTMKNGYKLSLTTAQAVNVNDNFKLGNESWYESYQNESSIIYTGDDFIITNHLLKYNGHEYIIAPNDIWISNEEDCITKNKVGLCYGATDSYPVNSNVGDLNNYKYIFNSTKEIFHDGTYYYVEDGLRWYETIGSWFGVEYFKKQTINLDDICLNPISECNFNPIYTNVTIVDELSGEESIIQKVYQFEVYFKAIVNGSGVVDIDPSYASSITSSGSDGILFKNATEGTLQGARLTAPVLFMDFNEPAEGEYVQDNSLYNNYGYLSSSNIVGNPDFETFTGTADDGASDDWEGWIEVTNDASGNRVEATTTKQSGTYAVKIVYTNNGMRLSQRFNVTPNQAYTWTFYTRGTGTVAGRFYAVCLNQTDSTVHTLYATQTTGITSSTYTQVSKPFTTPANCSRVEIGYIAGASVGSTVYFDNSVVSGASFDTGATYNLTAGYDGSGAYEFDGANDYIQTTIAQGINTTILWYKNSTASSWTHGVWLSNGTNYTNGVLGNPNQKPIHISGTTVQIGKTGASTFFNGSIDQVQIFNRALSADEILNLYNGTKNNSNFIGKYANSGDFKSLIYYNSTSSYWNVTMSTADTASTRTGIVTTNNEINLSDPNLVSYWKLDGNSLDATGRNNGTATGTNNATGLSSGALRFDGVDDRIDYGDSIGLEGATELTMSAWVKSVGSGTIMSEYYAASNHRTFLFQRSGSTYIWRLWNNGSGTGYIYGGSTSGVAVDNEWQHVTAVWKASDDTIAFYVNGENRTGARTTTAPIPNSYRTDSTADFLIGVLHQSGTSYANPFNGSIDEVLIYNKSLTASEVKALYKSGLSKTANTSVTLQTRTANNYNISDAGLVSFWSFNNDNSTTAIDEKGRNNATRVGSIADANEGNGTVGKGYRFDGVNDGINSTSISAFAGKSITMSTWINRLPVSDDSTYALSYGDQEAVIYCYASGSCIALMLNSTSQFYTTGYNFYNKGWTHAVLNYNHTNFNLSFYINGVLYSSVTVRGGALMRNNRFLGIGLNSYSTTEYFNGSIDEVRIYNRSLSADEIYNLYMMRDNHIEWTGGYNNWTSACVNTISEDGEASCFPSQSNFMQYKSILNTNDTQVSPYVLNYSVTTQLTSPCGGGEAVCTDGIATGVVQCDCVVSSNFVAETGNLFITGAGRFIVDGSTISNVSQWGYDKPNDCKVGLINGGKIGK